MHEPTFTPRQEALLAALGAAIRRAPTVPNFLVDDERTGGAELLLLHPGFEHGAMVEAGVILKHHTAIRSRPFDRFAQDQHFAAGGRVLRLEAGDQPQDRALAAAAGPEDADELSFVGQIFDDERNVVDRSERVRSVRIVRLRNLVKGHHRWPLCFMRCAHMLQHLAHADGASSGRGSSSSYTHDGRFSVSAAGGVTPSAGAGTAEAIAGGS